ncbi:MAG: PolC-type DNA polymerase III [Firmicutes bacterium]|nr:PolC-type DNA polymerase III [Bacillota bacterium]
MREIIEETLSKYTIGNVEKESLKYTLNRASIKREKRVLSVDITLNFVMPIKACREIADKIGKKLDHKLNSVELNFSYEDVILKEEDIIYLFLPHMVESVTGSFGGVSSTISLDNYIWDGRKLTIFVMGDFFVNLLNRGKRTCENMLRQNFGIDAVVEFINNEEKYAIEKKALNESEAEDIKQCMELHKKEMKQRASMTTAKKETDNTGWNKNQGGWQKGGGSARKREKELPAEGNRIMGHNFEGTSNASLRDIEPSMGTIIVSGSIFKMEFKLIKSGNYLMTILLTDNTTTICTKAFISESKHDEIKELLKAGDQIKIRGEVQWDTFENMNTIMIKDIQKLDDTPERMDTWPDGKRVELHAHTKMSSMDGLNEAADIVNTAAAWGQPAVAITDHGVVQSFPDAAKAAKKLRDKGKEIKIIYGMEGYVFDDEGLIDENGEIDYKKPYTNHIILLAATQEGLKNIYKLVSYSHLNYFYKRPRLPKSVIQAHREGIIIGSACEAGEVYQAFYKQKSHEEIVKIANFYDYLEIQPLINNKFLTEDRTEGGKYPDRRQLTIEELKDINRQIVKLGEELGKPVVATTDAHYDSPTSAIYRNIIMAGQGYKDAENGQGLYLRTTDEMMEEFSYLGEETARKVVIENTNLIADQIGDLLPVPKGKFPPKIAGAEETLRETCMEKAHSIYGDPLPEEIATRLDKELNSIIDNGYAVMYVSAQMLVKKSLEDGYLVGSRGSVGSSFAATMAGITEVNPLDPHYICPECKYLEWGDMELYDCGIDMPPKKCPNCGAELNRDGFTIPFATFLGFDGDKEPDIDLNFAGEYQPIAHKYVGTIFGEKNVFKAGTVGTVAEKTAYGYVSKFYEEQGIPINKYEKDRLTQHCTGIKRTTGQHPGGIIIVPDDHEIYEFCPVQHPANDVKSDIITTHFDYHKIDENLLKLDILGHNVPSMIRQLQDMTGIDPLNVPLTDRKVISIFNGIEALDIKMPDYRFTHGSYAIPEFGTAFVRQMLDDTKPDKFADLVRISGFSHGTDVWLNNAQDYIRNGTATMREVISTRDDIMNYLMLKGIENKTSFQIMEDVRKNRPLKESQLEVMKSHGVPDWYIDSCIKIQYMFPRAHAVAYVMMSFRMAWYKVYYPREFYATYFTSVVADFDSETILKGPDAILEKIDLIKQKGHDATAKEGSEAIVLEVAYEMYARGYEFMDMRLDISHATKFDVVDGKVLLPFMALNGMGETAAKSLAEAYMEKPFDTVEEISKRAKINKSTIDALRARGVLKGMPETDQLSFF